MVEIDNSPITGIGGAPLQVLVPGDNAPTHATLAGILMFLIGQTPATTIADAHELLSVFECLQGQRETATVTLTAAQLVACTQAVERAVGSLGVNAALLDRRLRPES